MRGLSRTWVAGLAALLLATNAAAQEAPKPRKPRYAVTFDAKLVPSEKSIEVRIELGPDASPVKWMLFRTDPMRHQGFEADGDLSQSDEGWLWTPPPGGGVLRYVFTIDHLRSPGEYDARSAKEWAIFRGEDLVPTVRIRTEPIAMSRSRMRLQLPEGWSAALPYARTVDGVYRVSDARTRFDRPKGWFLVGKLGVVRESVGDTRVTIAGPAKHGVRRMDLLALLRWTLPPLRELFAGLPDRLLIVSAGDPMWRGGLSASNSVYLHADRPLIEEDATSPILHELLHSLMRARAGQGGDWIVEGLAEHYSLQVLRRSETLSAERYETALERIEEKAQDAGPLRVATVDTATRARGVLVLREIDAAIREASGGARGLDDVVRRLAADPKSVVTSRFRTHCEEVAGKPLGDIFDPIGPEPEPPADADRAEGP